MNWRLLVLSNWKIVLLVIQIGLLAAALVTGKALADPVDDPIGPN